MAASSERGQENRPETHPDHPARHIRTAATRDARIWGMSKIWQLALEEEPAYVIEVLSEKFDGLSNGQKENILLHEIAHIPKNFSGSLLPHVKKRGKRNFDDRVRQLVRQNNKRK